jgi:adenosylcobyric acid synthase
MNDSNTKAFMFLGTASNVGKSLLTLALCRWLHRCGKTVAPFKALNVALNSYPASEGGEIGMAQAQQAIAAGLLPSVNMNPVLIKPGGNGHSQLVIRGQVSRDYEAMPPESRQAAIREIIIWSYRELCRNFEIIVLEGSGSPVEMNLKDTDLANLSMAEAANAQCVLVADVDRGGVFASVLGTWMLLSPSERSRFIGFIINKFYGPADAFSDGVQFIESQIGLRCLAVIPYLSGLHLKNEDSLDLPDNSRLQVASSVDPIRIGVIKYPNISNFTDFDAFELEPSVELRYCQRPADCENVDLLVLPGTKSTIADLAWLREQRLVDAIFRLRDKGSHIFGICGGMQMLGQRIEDPHKVEVMGGGGVDGLGLLPLRTVMSTTKVTIPVKARMIDSSFCKSALEGYEIHMGRSEFVGGDVAPLLEIWRQGEDDPLLDGARSAVGGQIWATYVHGLFDNDDFRLSLLNLLRREKGMVELPAVRPYSEHGFLAELDRWTDHVIRHLDPEFLKTLLNDQASTQHIHVAEANVPV